MPEARATGVLRFRRMPRASRPRLPIVISRAAGAGRPERHEETIRAALEGVCAPEFHYPDGIAALTRAVADAAGGGARVIAVGGGDGTLHHAVNAIARVEGSHVTLAPLPLGTGNDFCRSLGVAPGLPRALAALKSGVTRDIDVLDVNGARVLTVAGLGVVSDSGLQVGRLGKPGGIGRPLVRALGSMAYLGAAGARLLLKPKLARHASVSWRAQTGDAWQQADGLYYGIFLACRPTLGAGLKLPLDVPSDDGRFEIVLVERSPRLSVAMHLPRLRSGRPGAARHPLNPSRGRGGRRVARRHAGDG